MRPSRRGREGALSPDPRYVGVAIDVEQIADHRREAFVVESGIDRRWLDEDEQHALMTRVAVLTEYVAGDVPDALAP